MDYKKDYIVDEFLGLNDEQLDSDIEKEQKRIINELRKENIISNDISNITLEFKSDSFVSLIKDNVSFCVDQLKDVTEAMNKINSQKNSEMFFKKSENIKLISQYVSKMATVNQKTLDLLILLLGASSKIGDDYNTIISTIDELGQLNKGEAEVLNYLVKIKKMIFEIHDNESRLKEVLDDNAKTKEFITHADEEFKKEIQESERTRKLLESKCTKLQNKVRLNNLYIGICLLLVVFLAIFVGIKFYVH